MRLNPHLQRSLLWSSSCSTYIAQIQSGWTSIEVQCATGFGWRPFQPYCGLTFTHCPYKTSLSNGSSSLCIVERPDENLADSVGFEPTGLSPHQISSLRRYNHFGNYPQKCKILHLPPDFTVSLLLTHQCVGPLSFRGHIAPFDTYQLMEFVKLADTVGLEPTTHRLTADCSAIEPRIQIGGVGGVRHPHSLRIKQSTW